jgi:hypothetical protein
VTDEEGENQGEEETQDHVVEKVRGKSEDDTAVVPHPVVQMKADESNSKNQYLLALPHRLEA